MSSHSPKPQPSVYVNPDPPRRPPNPDFARSALRMPEWEFRRYLEEVQNDTFHRMLAKGAVEWEPVPSRRRQSNRDLNTSEDRLNDDLHWQIAFLERCETRERRVLERELLEGWEDGLSSNKAQCRISALASKYGQPRKDIVRFLRISHQDLNSEGHLSYEDEWGVRQKSAPDEEEKSLVAEADCDLAHLMAQGDITKKEKGKQGKKPDGELVTVVRVVAGVDGVKPDWPGDSAYRRRFRVRRDDLLPEEKELADILETLNRRLDTLPRIVEAFCEHQKDYLRTRNDLLLKPLTKSDVARLIGIDPRTAADHISTKYILAPWGRPLDLAFLCQTRAEVVRRVCRVYPQLRSRAIRDILRAHYGFPMDYDDRTVRHHRQGHGASTRRSGVGSAQ